LIFDNFIYLCRKYKVLLQLDLSVEVRSRWCLEQDMGCATDENFEQGVHKNSAKREKK
jgi:hypothetical protein